MASGIWLIKGYLCRSLNPLLVSAGEPERPDQPRSRPTGNKFKWIGLLCHRPQDHPFRLGAGSAANNICRLLPAFKLAADRAKVFPEARRRHLVEHYAAFNLTPDAAVFAAGGA